MQEEEKGEEVKKPAVMDYHKVHAAQENKQSLNALIKGSDNPKAVRLKDEIDNLKKERAKLITRIKDSRRRLSYKEAEFAAINHLLQMKKADQNYDSKRKRIGYLKKAKARLEFKISTEASSLVQEKEIVRKINETNKELDNALASVRLERKVGFVTKDIEDYKKQINDTNAQITELDTRLDLLYVGLRKALRIGSWKSKQQTQRRERPAAPEINLEDIAVIKKKDVK